MHDGRPGFRWYTAGSLFTLRFVASDFMEGEAFSFPVMHVDHARFTDHETHTCYGTMWISKTRIAYTPDYPMHRFNQLRTAVRFEYKKPEDRRKLKFDNIVFRIKGDGLPSDYFTLRDDRPATPLDRAIERTPMKYNEQYRRRFIAVLEALEWITSAVTQFDAQVHLFRSKLAEEGFAQEFDEPLKAGTRTTLLQLFLNNRGSDPRQAYDAAVTFALEFPEDQRSGEMRRWVQAFEKVSGGLR